MIKAIQQANGPRVHTLTTDGQLESFLTKDEVARRLKKSARTIENWQRKGFIPFVKVGTAVLYRWSDVEAHLQQNFRVCRLKAEIEPQRTQTTQRG